MGKPIIEITHTEYQDKKLHTLVTRFNSQYDGDWNKYDFHAIAIHKEPFLPYDLEWLVIERRAQKVFADGMGSNWQYLHVPYNWEDDMTIYRVYPLWEVGKKYRTSIGKSVTIKSVKVFAQNGNWYWNISLEDGK